MNLAARLKNPSILQRRCYINGKWAGEGKIAVTNPASLEIIGYVPDCSYEDTLTAIDAAERAFGFFKHTTPKERSAMLMRWYALITANLNDIAAIMTAEQGKPLEESKAEAVFAASFVEWYAEEGKRAYGSIVPTTKADRRYLVLRQPVGVVGAITPWNFPCSMITRKVAPAIAAGCTVVLKPSEETPFTALALAKLAEEAGFPAGVLNVVTGKAQGIGKALTESEIVRKLSFTGSTAVGKMLYAACAGTVKSISLELGGNAPFIVFADADIERAAKAAAVSRFRNSGQTCVCANRILVEDGIHDEFVTMLELEIKRLKPGDGFDPTSTQGPLINEKGVEKVERLVEEATAKGAFVHTGGERIKGGLFYQPSLLIGVTEEMAVAKEEIFGPVAAITRFKGEEEAVRLANNTPYGLAAYFFTRDMNRTVRVAENLEYGIVGVNEGLVSTEAAPFGGVKESGLGRECGREGLEGFLETKFVCLGGL